MKEEILKKIIDDKIIKDYDFFVKIYQLKDIIEKLRSKDGCPWDRKLEIENCAEFLLEETHEAIESIYDNDIKGLGEELGDILSQVFMISQIASEKNFFDIEYVIDQINNKLIFRHPHVFGLEKAENDKEVLEIWNKQKLKEKENRKNIMEGIPDSLPSTYIVIKQLRKLSQYPQIFNIIDSKIIENISSINDNFLDFINETRQFASNEVKFLKKDLSSNQIDKNNAERFIQSLLFIIAFYSFNKEIDIEKVFRKIIDDIYQIFEENQNKNENLDKNLNE
ncbi:MAG: MazG nucleotide pyrophosphohydrolase domain-containing protein [Exilispira sp.]